MGRVYGEVWLECEGMVYVGEQEKWKGYRWWHKTWRISPVFISVSTETGEKVNKNNNNTTTNNNNQF